MEENYKNILGPTIKFLRTRMGINQEEFVALLYNEGLKIDEPMLTRIENQTRVLRDFEFVTVIKILQVDYNDFFDKVSE